LASVEHINRTPDLDSLVTEFGLDFAQAFQILRPKLNAEMDRVRAEEKAEIATKVDAANQALSLKGSPSQSTTPLVSSPRVEAMQVDGEDGVASQPDLPLTEDATPRVSFIVDVG
jgi:THO complex subunit 2